MAVTAVGEAAAPVAGAAGWRARAWLLGWWVLPALVLAGFGGALVARRHGLWYDELYTAEVAPLPLSDLVRAVVRGEGTIPYLRDAPPSYNASYYVVVHVWLAVTGLAPDEVGLRLLSLLSAIGGVAAATVAAGRLAGRRVALVFGLVVAANPFVVEYSAEARGYGLALLASGLLALAFARWLDGCPRAALFVGLAAAGLGLAHWFGLLVLGGVAAAALLLRRREAVALLPALALGAVPTLLLVGLAVGNGVGGSGAEWLVGVGGDVPRLVLRSWSGRSLWLLALTLAVAGAGLVLGRGRARVVGAAWFGVPVAVVALAELVRPVYVDRYLLPAMLGLALLMALGATALRPRWLGIIAVSAVMAASAAASFHLSGLGSKQDSRAAIDAVADRHAPGEPVVAAARWDALGVDHHARRDHPLLVPDLVLPPEPIPEGTRTLWVVRRQTGGLKGDEDMQAGLDGELAARGLRLLDEQRFPGRYATTLVQHWGPPS